MFLHSPVSQHSLVMNSALSHTDIKRQTSDIHSGPQPKLLSPTMLSVTSDWLLAKTWLENINSTHFNRCVYSAAHRFRTTRARFACSGVLKVTGMVKYKGFSTLIDLVGSDVGGSLPFWLPVTVNSFLKFTQSLIRAEQLLVAAVTELPSYCCDNTTPHRRFENQNSDHMILGYWGICSNQIQLCKQECKGLSL